jgi:PAS domain S-box-containing protein
MPGETNMDTTPTRDAEESRRQLDETKTQLARQKGLDRILGQREELYRTVLESLAEGLLIRNAESRIVYANSQLDAITGYPKDELLGMVSYELLHPPEHWPGMRKRLEERLAGKSESYEHEILRKDGSRQWIQVRATPYRNAHGEIIGTIGANTIPATSSAAARR